jgi:hypothetical protein
MKWYYLPVVTAASLAASAAFAADLASKKAPAAPPPAPTWLSTLTVDGYVEGGIAVNFNQPFNKLNWGHLYTDRANWPTFNGAVLTVQRPIDPKSETYDFGFKVQGQLGEDARYNHLTGFLDYAIPSRTQIAVLEANAQAHLPWKSFISQGGVDVKAGIFPTYNGAELMYAKDNLFYSHSYIFNFGPFLHTGLMTTTHVRDWLDVYAGVTTGVNNWIGYPGQPNSSPSFHGGVGLNLLDGNLTILGIVHHGPQNSSQGRFNYQYTPPGAPYLWPNNVLGGIAQACLCDPNSANRTFTNLTTTWKVTENLTLITDMAYNRESGWNGISYTGFQQAQYGVVDPIFAAANPAWPGLNALPQHAQGADSYAVAQYASYKINDLFKVNARVEYYRDNKSFFVAGFPGYYDSVNSFHGFACPSCIAAPGFATQTGTSYFAMTLGATITPELPKMPIITGMILRPELRWDTSVNGTQPFFRGVNGSGNGRSSSQGMFNMDVIIPFSLL